MSQLRTGDTIYNVLDQYTGETITYNKVSSTPAIVDDIMFIQIGSEYFKRNTDGLINVLWYGAKNDGVTDSTLAIKNASLQLQNGNTLFFPPGTYLISYQGAAYASVYGYAVVDLTGLKNVIISGEGATIKAVNHNITTNGGFRFINFSACQFFTVKGFYFDMTFTGANVSGSFYPWCGAIVGMDAADNAGTYDTRNNDIFIKDCVFKLFHLWGAYTFGTNPYAGDPNNGYKLFAVFLSGDHTAALVTKQNNNVIISDCKLLNGHNGYGFWIWAYNNIQCLSLKAESYVSKKSNVTGGAIGDGLPFIRYHQFLNSGIRIVNCDYKAKPSNERLTAGFEGSAGFCNLDTNQTGDYSHGSAFISRNSIINGRGDAAHSLPDISIYIFCYGDIDVSNNYFDENNASAVNAFAGSQIFYNAQVVGGNGSGTMRVKNNTFGPYSSYSNNIIIANGSTVSAAQRRLKSLDISGNFSYGQNQYFLQILNTSTYNGVATLNITDVLVDGSANTVYNSASTNSRAMSLAASETTDVIKIQNLIVRNKYYGILNDVINAAAVYEITSPLFIGVTLSYVGTAPISPYLKRNTVTNRIPKNSGNNDLANSSIADDGASITVDLNVIANGFLQAGKSGTGTGGTVKLKNDAGTLKWQAGHLGSGGAIDYVIYDLVNGRSAFIINGTSGLATLFAGLVTGGDATLNGNTFISGSAYIGKAGAAGGGALRLLIDTGAQKWLMGLLTPGGTINFTLYDLVNSVARLTIDGTNGEATFSGKVGGATPTAAGHLTTKAYVDARMAAANVDAASANATDLATAITLVNELKTVVNSLQAKLRTATLLTP